MRVTRIDASGGGAVGPMGMPGFVRPYSPIWTGLGLAYTGTPATGRYAKIGNLVFFDIQVELTTVTNFGSTNNGHYHITLPYPPDGHYAFRSGSIHHSAQGYNYAIMGDANDGDINMSLWYMSTNGHDQVFDANSPHTLTVNDYFYLSGLYIRA